MSRIFFIISLSVMCLLASIRGYAQTDGDESVNLQNQVALLIEDVYEKGLISMGMKDSITRYVTDVVKVKSDRDYDKMLTLRNYIMRSLKSPNIYNEMKKEILPETINAPMSEDGCVDKGVEGFYKNKRGMKYEGAGWADPERDKLLARRAVANANKSVSKNLTKETPAFISDLTESNNFFLKILGGLLKGFYVGAKV